MTQHQNPQEVLQSLQQPTSLGCDNGQSDLKPFSIREYVRSSRQKNIFHSWPFPEKYLNMFLDHGIKTVLPPFEPHHLAIQSLSGRRNRLNDAQPVKEGINVCDPKTHQSGTTDSEKMSSKSDETVSEICNPNGHLSPSDETDKDEDQNDCRGDIYPCNGALYLTRSVVSKRNTSKKKYVVDILNAAKTCTSQNLRRVRRLRRGLRKDVGHGVEKNGNLTRCESELTDDQFLESKLRMDDCEGAALDMSRTKKWVLKFKFRGRSSQNSRKTSTLKGNELKVLQLRK